ncbi:Kinesin-like protein kif20a [Puccinia graminis f. sp. tritici]|uniref:Kinesin-like protein kif20a n=1 Tax=Puccinia graminis f. sp. tritici TaxID=56615 RepID=A0A5B0NUT0_PUCGR|nr:Kinesin-like protein kif20a [Puccinia graminis f. sp. tritici]
MKMPLEINSSKDVTDPIPGSVFIGDWIENGPNTGYRYRIAPPNPIPMYWTTGIGWSDPILIPARSIWVPDWDCNAIPIPIRYHFDTIPWDWITLSDLIPYFLIPGIEKSIRSDKSADTVSDRICFTVDSSIPKDRSHSVMTLKPDELCA